MLQPNGEFVFMGGESREWGAENGRCRKVVAAGRRRCCLLLLVLSVPVVVACSWCLGRLPSPQRWCTALVAG